LPVNVYRTPIKHFLDRRTITDDLESHPSIPDFERLWLPSVVAVVYRQWLTFIG
jgi:hypothetical protein